MIRILLGSESRAPVRELVADWYRSLRCFVDPGRALYVSTRRTTGYLGPAPRAPSEVFDTYVEEFEAAHMINLEYPERFETLLREHFVRG